MEKQQTCGQGLAENSALPAKLGEMLGSVAEILETHRAALNVRDANARREDEAYRELAEAHRKIAGELREAAKRMADYRNLPMGKHDPALLSAPKAVRAFESFVTLEGQLSALLQRRLTADRAMLDEMLRAG